MNLQYKTLIKCLFILLSTLVLNKSISQQINCKSGVFSNSRTGTYSFCKGDSLKLYYGDTSGNSKLYQWYYGKYPKLTIIPNATHASIWLNKVDTMYLRVIDTSNSKWDTGYCTTFSYITIDPNPKVSFSFTPNTACGKTNIKFTNSSTISDGTYLIANWTWGDGSTENNNSNLLSHYYTPSIGSGNDNFIVTLVDSNYKGCKDSISQTLTIGKRPDATLGGNGSTIIDGKAGFKQCTSSAYNFNFINKSTTTSINSSYKIIWGDGSPNYNSSSFSSPISHLYQVGVNRLIFIVTSSNCIDSNIYTVFVGNVPAGGIASPGGSTICSGSPQAFIVTNYLSNPLGTTYTLHINDGSTDTIFTHSQIILPHADTLQHQFNISSCGNSTSNGTTTLPNSFGAFITISNPCGSSLGSILPIYVSSKPQSSFTISDTIVCINSTIALNSTSSKGNDDENGVCNPGISVWNIKSPKQTNSFQVITGSTGNNNGFVDPSLWIPGTDILNLKLDSVGIYKIDLETSNNTLCGTSDTSQTICVNPTPIAKFYSTKKTICAGDTLTAINTSPLPLCGSISYKWSITSKQLLGCQLPSNPIFNDTATNPKLKFASPGTYVISLTTMYLGSNCTSLPFYDTIIVNDKPVLNITSPSSTCQYLNISPSATATCNITNNTTYAWSFPSNVPSSSTSLSPGSISMNTVGTDTIKFSATNSCGTASTFKTILVNQTPLLDTIKNIVVCAGSTIPSIVFGSNVVGTTFGWTNNNSAIGIAATGSGNINSFTASNNSTSPITATITVTPTYSSCIGLSRTFTITVNPTPTVNGISDINQCSGTTITTITFAGNISTTTYNWTNSNTSIGIPATGNANINSFQAVNNSTSPIFGTITVTPTVNSCPGAPISFKITINPLPVLTVNPSTNIVCSGNNVVISLNSSITGSSYLCTSSANGNISGNTNNSTTITNNSITDNLSTTSSTDVTVTYSIIVYGPGTSNCQGNTVSFTVVVKPGVSASNAGTAQQLCNQASVTLAGNNPSVGTGTWTQVAGNPPGAVITSINQNNTTVTNLPYGVLNFQWTITGSGGSCPSSSSTVQITNRPVVTIANAGTDIVKCDFSGTNNNTVTLAGNLDNTRAFETGQWTIVSQPTGGNGTFSNNANPLSTFTYSSSGIYILKWTISNDITNCIPTNDNVQITVYDLPVGGTTNSPATVCKGQNSGTISLTGNSGTILKWQYAIGNSTIWVDTSVISTSINYLNLDTTTRFRVVVQSLGTVDNCNSKVYSTETIITVNSVSSGGILSGTTAVCSNGNTGSINLTGYNGTINNWQYSIDNGQTWQTLGGVSGSTYNYNNLANTTEYQVVVHNGSCPQSLSSIATITVNQTPTLSSSLTTGLCNGKLLSYQATSTTSNVRYSWTRAAMGGGDASASSVDTTGLIQEILNNNTTDTITVIYQINLFANGCSNTQNFNVTVNPTPLLSSPKVQSICSGIVFNYPFTSTTQNTTFNWKRAKVAGLSNPTTSLPGDIAETFNNNSSSPIVATYQVSLSANGCPNSDSIKLTINPSPSLTSTSTPKGICNNNKFVYIPTSATLGTNFFWSRAAITDNPFNSGNDSIQETLLNSTTGAIVATYTITLKANGCSTTQNITDTIYPAPSLSSTPNPSAICNGSTFSYHPISATPNVNYNWSRASITGILPATKNSGTNDINETLTNTTFSTINVVYTYDMPANGCDNKQNVTVPVYPTPDVFIPNDTILCNGSMSGNFNFNGNVIGTIFNWKNDNTSIGLKAIDSVNIISFPVINTGTSNSIGVISVTPKYNQCPGTTKSFNITVKPTPSLLDTTANEICNGSLFIYQAKSATVNVKFSWTRAAIIGNAYKSSADTTGKIADTLINTTTDPIIVTYQITSIANGCTNTQNLNVTVNPTPLLSSPKVQSVCSGVVFNYTPNSTTQSTSYTWTRAAVHGLTNGSGSGNGAVAETFINSTPYAILVTYLIKLSANGCNNSDSLKVSVNPSPVLSSTFSPKGICNNNQFYYTPTSATSNVSFSWKRAFVTGISNNAANGIDSINETLFNTTPNPVVVTYVYTLSSLGCTGSSSITDSVYPSPVLSSTLTPAAICDSTMFSYTPTSLTNNISFNWSRAVVNGITNLANNGQGTINEVLYNNSNVPVNVTYVYNMPSNGCDNKQSVIVSVNPTTTVVVPGDTILCDGNSVNPILFSSTVNNTIYNWTNSNSTIGLTSTGIGNISPFIATDNGVGNNVGIISVIPSINNCNGIPNSFTITVSPTPRLNSPLTSPSICTGTIFNYVATSATNNVKFSWTRNAIIGISNPTNNSNDSLGIISETLINITNSPITVVYNINLIAAGCINSQSISVIVNPDSKANYSYTSNALCAPGIYNAQIITATSYPNANSNYQWYANNNLIGTSITFPGFTIQTPGDSATFKLVTTSLYGCKSDSITNEFYTVIKPLVAFTKSTGTGCGPLTVTFSNTTTPLNEPKYLWNFGNGITSTLASPPAIIFVSDTSNQHKDTTYYILLTATTQCDTIVVKDSVLVKPTPKALFQPDTTVGCSPFNFHAINNSLGGPNTYYWSFGDKGFISTSDTSRLAVNHVYHTGVTDTFNVKLIATNACGVDSFIVAVLVYPNSVFPKLIVNGQQTYACAPQNVQFVNNSYGGNRYTIDFGDKSKLYISSRSQDTIYHLYSFPGTYPVTLYGSNGCSDTTSIQNIVIYPKPKALFSVAKQQFCAKENVHFTNLSDTGLYYFWNFGDGYFSTAINPDHYYTTAGNYTISVAVSSVQTTGSICTDTFSLSITVNPITPAIIKSNISSPNCQPYTFLSNLPKGLYSSVDWIFSNPYSNDTIRAGNNVSYTFPNVGTYPVTLMVLNNFGCGDTAHTSITVSPTPLAKYTTTDSIFCSPQQTLTFPNNSTYRGTDFVSYSWLVNGVIVDNNSQQLTYTYNAKPNNIYADTFKVTLLATSSMGCSNTISKNIVLIPKPLVRIAVSTDKACAPATIIIGNGTLYADTYKWYLDGILYSTQQNSKALVLANQNTTYHLKLVASNTRGCGVDSSEQILVTYANPIAKFSLSDSSSCTGSLTGIFADQSTSSGTNISLWNWTFGDGGIGNSNPEQHSYNLPGTYFATLYVYDARGCKSDLATRRISVFGKPAANYTTTNTCEGINSIFNSYSTIGVGSSKFLYQAWDFGDGFRDTGNTVNHIYNIPGIYTVKLTVMSDSSCIPVSTIQSVAVYGKPQANFTSVNNCAGLPIIFTNQSKPGFGEQFYQTLYWYFGDGSNLSQPNVQHTYKDSGIYQVKLIVTGYKCGQLKDTMMKQLKVVEARSGMTYPIVYASYYTPTLLTAANDGISYAWSPTIGLLNPASDTSTAIYTPNDNNKVLYTITIIDSSGCVMEDKQEVWVFIQPDIMAPSGFTPNGDGVNDILIPNYVNIKKLDSWRIYDRWGNMIFETNNMLQGWDGKINGANAPMETYTWVAQGVTDKNETIIRKGMTTLIRE